MPAERHENQFLYVLPFQDDRMFKVGVTSGDPFPRIMCHNRQFKGLNPHSPVMLKVSTRKKAEDLENSILAEFNKYKMEKEARALYPRADSFNEILGMACHRQVLDFIEAHQQDSESGIIESIEGFSIPGLYTDDHVSESPAPDWSQIKEIGFAEAIDQLGSVLSDGSIRTVNVGYRQVRRDLTTIYYLILAEPGLEDRLLGGARQIGCGMKFLNLTIRHRVSTGNRVRSGATYILGEILLTESWKPNTEAVDFQSVCFLSMLVEKAILHPKRDPNYKVVIDNGRHSFIARFKAYEPGRRHFSIRDTLKDSYIL